MILLYLQFLNHKYALKKNINLIDNQACLIRQQNLNKDLQEDQGQDLLNRKNEH